MNIEQLENFGKWLCFTKKLSDKTISDYLFYASKFDVGNISQEYINAFAQNHTNNSVVRGFLLNYLEYANLKKVYDMPPKKTGRKPQKVITPLTELEITDLRKYAYSKSFKRGVIIDLIYYGALRRSELIKLRINSFLWEEWLKDINKPIKLLVEGKGAKDRIVLIPSKIAQSIFYYYNMRYNFKTKEQLKAFFNSDNLLIATQNKKPLDLKYLYNLIRKTAERSISKSVNPHLLRHSRATHLVKKGISLNDVKYYLGHSSIAVTEKYLHVLEEESIAEIEKIY